MDRSTFASPPVAARPEAGEMSIAPYKRRGFGGAQCGVRRAHPLPPEHTDFEKTMYLFEGLWIVFWIGNSFEDHLGI